MNSALAELRDDVSDGCVLDGLCAELAPALTEVILARAARGRSTPSLNRGGWKSGEGMLEWTEPPVVELRRALIELLRGQAPIAWAMVNRAGSEHPRHQHRIAVISGVYYIAPGDPSVPTILELPAGELAVDPVPGRVALFSGETWHRVPKYEGISPRVTIAFDVRRR